MRVFSPGLLLAAAFLLGCPNGGPGIPPVCSEGRVCPRECSDTTACSTGETCQDGLCGTPAPTSVNYSGCLLDADCGSGDHCSLGACGHECLADRDCTGGSICSSRGRCTTVEQLAEVPPVVEPTAPTLKLAAAPLEFGRTIEELTFTLENDGGSPLAFRILSSRPWVSAEPSSGTISGQPLTITVRVDRGLAGADTHAFLRVNSTGGTGTVDVGITRNVGGRYSGEVRFNQPFEIADSALQFNLFELPDGTAVTGYVDPERSLLFPVKAGVSGTVDGDALSLQFVVAGAKGSLVNPHFPRSIRRTLTLSGTFSGSGTIEGTVTDSISGPIEGRPVVLTGTFRLQRAGEAVPGQADPIPDLSFPPVTSPFAGSDYDVCRACPVGGDCSTDLLAGDSFLKTSANFYTSFQNATSTDGSPFDIIGRECDGSCLDEGALRCAQYRYSKHLEANPGNLDAAIGLLDTFEVLTDYAMLFGNDRVVTATENWKTQGTLDSELAAMRQADGYYTAGTHSADVAHPIAALDPLWLKTVLSSVPAAALASANSRLPALLGDFSGRRAGFEHLRRSTLAIGGSLRAGLEIADRHHRLGELTQARSTTWAAAMQAYLDLALLSELLEHAGAAPATFLDVRAVLADFQAVSKKFDDLNSGRNPAGYLSSYVPFRLETTKLPLNNYEQIWRYAADEIYGRLAKPTQDVARDAGRDFEASIDGLFDQISAQKIEHERQIHDLCGTQDVSQCGQPGSAVASAASELRAAALRIQLAHQRIVTLSQEIDIETDRARRVSGVHDAQARLILQNGKELNAIAEQQRMLDLSGEIFNSFASLPSALATPPPGAGVFKLLGGLMFSVASQDTRKSIEERRNNIASFQSAQVEFNASKIETINSAALIKTKLLETASLSLELEIAKENASQAMGNLVGLRERAALLAEQRARVEANNRSDTRRLLHFRMFADAKSLKAQDSFRLMMKWAFFATRALEYQLNVSYPSTLDLFTSRDADELNAYLVKLDEFYQNTRPGPAQTYWEVLSLRDDLLDLQSERTDAVTSHVYDAREQFRRFVANPANRDLNGNFRVAFMTHRPDKQMFSRAVCNDRIRSIRINLVGDNLGTGVSSAMVKVAHGGTNFLRSCGGDHSLVPYDLAGGADNAPRSAQVQAGINAPDHARGLPENTDLITRSTLAGPWELTIDQRPDFEPDNAGLNLGGLDDIEIVIEHEAYTIQ